MEDKFIKGILGGIIAGVVKDIPIAVLCLFPKLIGINFWDYAGAIALGRLPNGLAEHVYAFFLEILFSIFLGVIFINIPLLNHSSHLKVKGALFGTFAWFIIRAAVLAFQIQPLLGESLGNSITNLLISIFYGYILSCLVKLLDKKQPYFKVTR